RLPVERRDRVARQMIAQDRRRIEEAEVWLCRLGWRTQQPRGTDVNVLPGAELISDVDYVVRRRRCVPIDEIALEGEDDVRTTARIRHRCAKHHHTDRRDDVQHETRPLHAVLLGELTTPSRLQRGGLSGTGRPVTTARVATDPKRPVLYGSFPRSFSVSEQLH